VPISRLLGDGSTLVLGGPDHDARPQWALPVTLCSASLPNEVDTAVVAFSAITFLQFIGREQ